MEFIKIFCIFLLVAYMANSEETADSTCSPPCPAHSTCRPTPEGIYFCDCHKGYMPGLDKDRMHNACVPQCSAPCPNNLTCVAVDKCGCELGYYQDLEQLICLEAAIGQTTTSASTTFWDNELEGSGFTAPSDDTHIDEEGGTSTDDEKLQRMLELATSSTESSAETIDDELEIGNFNNNSMKELCGKVYCPDDSRCDNSDICRCRENYVWQAVGNEMKCIDATVVERQENLQNRLNHFYIALGLACMLLALLSLVAYMCHR